MMHNEILSGIQTTRILSQTVMSNGTPILMPEESKQHNRDIVHERHLYVNVVTEVNNNELHCLHEKESSGIQVVATSSQSDLVDGTGSLVAEEAR
jgi:hypothetical protein